MGKIMALDIGDRWIGSALSDTLKIIALPYKTVPALDLTSFIQQAIKEEPIEAIVIGYPQTMRGGISQQTEKVLTTERELKTQFPSVPFTLWDERLSSKRAQAAAPARTHEEKQKSHAIAAAFILDSYLTFLSFQQPVQQE